MFTETLNSTSKNKQTMEFENSIEEQDDDDDDDDQNYEDFPPLPSEIDLPSYTETPGPYDNRHKTLDLLYRPSSAFPSPPPLLPTSSETLTRIYANAHTFTSNRNHDSTNQPIVSFATQQRKKNRAPVACLFENIYVNMPKPRSPPPLQNLLHTPNEITYATLLNTTSMMPSIISDLTIKSVQYQQIQHKFNEMNHSQIYENIKHRRPPPPPYSPPTTAIIKPARPASWSIIPIEDDLLLSPSKIINKDMNCSPLATHIYINLEYHNDKPPAIPTRRCKSVRITVPTSPSPSPPPAVPPRNEQNQDIRCSSSSTIRTPPIEKEQDIHETSSNASTVPTVKELQVNKTSDCGDKSDLYRTKMPLPAATTTSIENPILPSFLSIRQRRALLNARRRRLRGSVGIRASSRLSNNSRQTQQQQQSSNSNATVRHPMVTDDRWRRTLHKRRQQRALQMKLDGNTVHRQSKSRRPVSDHTYNEIKPSSITTSNNRTTTNGHNGTSGGVLERAMQFNGALRDRVFSWYRGANHNNREQQTQEQGTQPVFSTTDNGESDLKDTTANEEEEEEDDEDDEAEFFTHDTFEDFLLRRRPKSSNSTITSGTSTVVSHIDATTQRLPVRTSSSTNKKSHIPVPPPPPPPLPAIPPPLPPSPPPMRRLPGLALSLDKTDVDFIHNMLQRTRGDHRVWNRITALKEAYIRATSKKNAQPKKPKSTENKNQKKPVTIKHSLAATKIRAELEKYDELPGNSPTHDEDDYDITCSNNIPPKSDFISHHRSVPFLPQTTSTTDRILNFVTSIKRRAQSNVQQLQKNLHDIRSRVHIESMTTNPHITIQRHASTISRQKQNIKDTTSTTRTRLTRVETTPNIDNVFRRTNSHRLIASAEHSTHVQRRQFNRTQSNASQLPQQQKQKQKQRRSIHHQPNQTPDLTARPSERRSRGNQMENETISRQHHSRKLS